MLVGCASTGWSRSPARLPPLTVCLPLPSRHSEPRVEVELLNVRPPPPFTAVRVIAAVPSVISTLGVY